MGLAIIPEPIIFHELLKLRQIHLCEVHTPRSTLCFGYRLKNLDNVDHRDLTSPKWVDTNTLNKKKPSRNSLFPLSTIALGGKVCG